MSLRFREDASVPTHIVTSRANARIKQLRAATNGNNRLSGGLVAIEGEILIAEALRGGLLLKTIFVSERRPVPSGLPTGIEVLRCANEVLQSAVETQSPQGIAALLLPRLWTIDEALSACPLLLVAVRLQDPGNLGTLIRSAEAFGASGILLTEGTVGAWTHKTIRASAGSVFRIPTVAVTRAEVLALKTRGVHLLAAVAAGTDTLSPAQVNLAQPCALLIGNEGTGLTPEWAAVADRSITIPCPGPVESLNAAVAGSLLLYEASRQRSAQEGSRIQ